MVGYLASTYDVQPTPSTIYSARSLYHYWLCWSLLSLQISLSVSSVSLLSFNSHYTLLLEGPSVRAQRTKDGFDQGAKVGAGEDSEPQRLLPNAMLAQRLQGPTEPAVAPGAGRPRGELEQDSRQVVG